MANPHRGQSELRVGDETFTLSFSLNSICEVEDATGEDIQAVLSKVEKNDFKAARLILWGALLDHHPEVSLKDAGALIPEGGFPALVEALTACVQRSFPQDDGAPAGNPPKASRRGTGQRSK